MLRNNLATRPFYNETAVRLWLTAIAVLVAAATVFNGVQWIRHSKSDTDLAAQGSADESAARDLLAQARRLRATVDTSQIQATAVDADQANTLIGRRVFSWTELFNQFEATIPANLRITLVRQRVGQERGSVLTIGVQARTID